MQNIKEAPIGVFDSGVGGLTVAREIMRQSPQERIVYFGDTARVPYGGKSTDTLIRYTRQIVRFLKTRGVKAIVVACNTASAVALEAVREELDIPIIALSQLSRSVEQGTEKKPSLSHLRESGSLEQDADIVMFIYRDEYYNEDSDKKGQAEIIIAKHRNGATGSVDLSFRKEFTKFGNLSRMPG